MGFLSDVNDHIAESSNAMFRVDRESVLWIVKMLIEAKARGVFVWLAGNGGSASTASHFANDLRKQCLIKAISIPDLGPTISAYGNDEGWSEMYAGVVAGYAGPRDLVVLFSCSGDSENVVKTAQSPYGGLIVFTGNNRESRLVREGKSEVVVFVDHPDIMVQESVHLILCHAIVAALKKGAQDVGT